MTARVDDHPPPPIAEILRLSGPLPDPTAHAHYLATLDPILLQQRLELLRQQQKEFHGPR